MVFALLLSLLAPAPVAAQEQNPGPGYEQLGRRQDAFVQSAGTLLLNKASRPADGPAILATGAAASAQSSSHPFSTAAIEPASVRASASAAPYLARAPPAAA